MKVRRCDCCGKDIEPGFAGTLFKMKKYYIHVSGEEAPCKQWCYDLCDECAKIIRVAIEAGGKKKKED